MSSAFVRVGGGALSRQGGGGGELKYEPRFQALGVAVSWGIRLTKSRCWLINAELVPCAEADQDKISKLQFEWLIKQADSPTFGARSAMNTPKPR